MRRLRKGKPFAKAVVTDILLADSVPTDKEIIARVLAESRSRNFDRFDLSWYKTKARQGKLKGQTGERYVIRQERAKSYDD